MRKFKLLKDPYEEDVIIFNKKTISIKSGVTVLVGCNGYGKSTLLNCIKSQLSKENVPCLTYDERQDGGSRSVSNMFFYDQFPEAAQLLMSSEGERIYFNIGDMIRRIGKFIRSNGTTSSAYEREGQIESAFKVLDKLVNGEKNDEVEHKEYWFLFDAIDSGLSVDNMVEIMDAFKFIVDDCLNKGIETYFIISTNSYELARDNNCFDVYSGKYLKFKSYEEYRDFVLKSREIKGKRYE